MIEFEPSDELAELLRIFEERGGVLEFGFYQAEQRCDEQSLHHQAAFNFLDQCAKMWRKNADELDYERNPMIWYHFYKWEPDALRGMRISFQEFWNESIDAFAKVNTDEWLPIVRGYEHAFFHPPHRLEGGVEGNQSLFEKINQHLFGDAPDSLSIWIWSTDCSNYFDDGREYWGAYLWTLSAPDSQAVTVIVANATD